MCLKGFNLLGCKFLGMLGEVVYQKVKGLQDAKEPKKDGAY